MWFRNTDSEWHWIYTKVKLINVTCSLASNVDAELKWKAGNAIKKYKNNHIVCPRWFKTKVCINLGIKNKSKKAYLKKEKKKVAP